MTAPEVDKAQRLIDNMESFIHNHSSELFIISSVLDKGIDEVIMEMLLEGYVTIRANAQQITGFSNERWEKSLKAMDEAVKVIARELGE